MALHDHEREAALADDLTRYGGAFELRRPDGTRARVDPADVIFHPDGRIEVVTARITETLVCTCSLDGSASCDVHNASR